ncbi:hypothetical protein BASA81_009883 [Batrachochytrium salamandrivorans]|nr:hypothetical protein BASA81_009883 [Batrachochytrium salamandrivorans]
MNFGSKESSSAQDKKRFELLERARLDRLDRSRKKAQDSAIIQLQAKFRGQQARKQLEHALASEIGKHMADIQKVQQVVLQATGKAFCLPAKPCSRLLHCFKYLISRARLGKSRVVLEEWFPKFSALLVGTLLANPPFVSNWRELRSLLEYELLLLAPLLIASSQAPLVQLYFTGKRTCPEAKIQIVSWMLTEPGSQRLKGNPSLACALFHPCLFQIPGFFSSQTDGRIIARLRLDAPMVLTALLNQPALQTDEVYLAQFGNLLASQLDSSVLLWQVYLEYLAHRLPFYALAGQDGVGWANNKVVMVNKLVWRQIDLYLANTMQRMCTSSLLQVNAELDLNRLRHDLAEWDKTPSLAASVPTASLFGIFTLSSSWAQRLLGSSKPPNPSTTASSPSTGPLQNISNQSRALAHLQNDSGDLFLHPQAWAAFSQLLCQLLYRWPANTNSNPLAFACLNACSFSNPHLVEQLWVYLEDHAWELKTRNRVVPQELFWGGAFVLCWIGSHMLLVTDESELFLGKFMNRHALERCVTKLNQSLYELDETALGGETSFSQAYVTRCVRFLSLLRDMHSRRALMSETAWTTSLLTSSTTPHPTSLFQRFKQTVFNLDSAVVELTPQEQLHFGTFCMFWSIPFDRKAKLLCRRLALERTIHQPPDEPPTYKLRVRRKDHGLKEAVPFFLKSDLRKRVYVVFENDFGVMEAGIDARGLFKEFIQTLAERVFAPDKGGLFAMTAAGDQGLYPNPKRTSTADAQQFTFAGKLLGKALFEGLIIQPQFSLFILAKLLGKLVSIGDLASLDQELFKNLLFLKSTPLDVGELDLVFTTTCIGTGKEVELFPGGETVPVTNANKYRYVNAVAHYKLNVEARDMHYAFVQGFYSVIRLEWIEHFSERELQMLISGNAAGRVDLANWKQYTTYSGGYFFTSPVVVWFWQVVEHDLTQQEHELLLRFATACSRAPLLGFGLLEPRFQIQRVSAQDLPLPTSSTCFNTLKLPNYSSKQVLKQKLLQAIHSNAGFELS